MITCRVLQIYQDDVVHFWTCKYSDALQFSFLSHGQVRDENRLRGQSQPQGER